ncbi:MAG: MBL fold metallo-hydrolase [Bdellovibrionaceae bacterium]|nr:MBL fold metallo-hydrolase [Bdellovibrionales bacterium]MCB9083316.1 MBL fold metallo-hydrolase [Pseudobdellovibrionaceae bacterium]
MIFRQLFDRDTCTYTYLLADSVSRDAVIIDPVREQFERDMQILGELNLQLRLILETHIHADHVTGAALLRRETGAKVGVAAVAGAEGVDKPLVDGQVLDRGEIVIKVLATPGHTNSCLSYFVGDRVFTGDALFIRGCGRTDFQQGDSAKLFKSVREKLFALPDDTFVYPGHDYKGQTVSTIGEEKRYNPRLRLNHTIEDFARIMSELKLDPPVRIKEAVPANLKLGEGNPQ